MKKIILYKIVCYCKTLVVLKIDRSFEMVRHRFDKCCLLSLSVGNSTFGISLIQSHMSVFQSPSGVRLESSAVTQASA